MMDAFSRLLGIRYWLLLWLTLSGAATAAPGSISLNEGSSISRSAEATRLMLQFSIDPSATIADAIKHGIAIAFRFEIEFRNPQAWPWKRELETGFQNRELRFLPLARQYEIGSTGQAVERFFSLQTALAFLGNYNIELTGDNVERAAAVRARLLLDRSALPIPLRNHAYLNPDWRLNSGWHEWSLTNQ